MVIQSGGETIAMGTKAHVLYGRLLQNEDYYALLRCDSTTEIASYLRHAGSYGAGMETLPATHVHRIDLEGAVRASIMSDSAALLFYIHDDRRAVFRSWLDWYDAENLKSVFRWIRSRRLSAEEIRRRIFTFPGSRIDYDQMLVDADFAGAHEALRGTQYFEPLSEPVKRLTEGEESLFSLELAIDNLIERNLYQNLHKLSDQERALLRPFFGTRIDLLNIYCLVRCLLYFRMTMEEALSRMLPVKYRIKTRHLREVARCATWKERLEKLNEFSPLYAGVFGVALESQDFDLAMEVSMKRFNYLQAFRIFHTGSPGFHTAIAYCLLKSYEVDDIIKIIEDVRYDYDRRGAAQYFIRPIAAEGGVLAWR